MCWTYLVATIVASKLPLNLFTQGYTISYKVVYFHYEGKKNVLQLTLQHNFLVTKNIYNSLHLYVVNVNGQVACIVELQLNIYMMQLIGIQLQLYQNTSFSTIMQLHYNYTHDVRLTSLIVIHLFKS
jgi:hypothetical protein